MKLIIEETDIMPGYDMENISPKGEMLLFDIETTGLKKETTQIYLIGCGYFNDKGNFEIRQWLAQSASDEREVLEAFLDFAKDFRVLVHFNGDGFDIPYVEYKADYYGFGHALAAFDSFDIYRCIKPYKKFLGMDRMNQTSVERFLGVERRDKMNGGLLIPYYYEFERTGDPECERLLLLHNNDDIRGMINLADMLSYADLFRGRYKVRNCAEPVEVFGDTCILEFDLESPVPVPVIYENSGLMIAAERNLLQINIKIVETEARIPLPNVEDYYYLPEEDRVIHKDVAAFVDKKYRRKATVKNCFLKKKGRFVDMPGTWHPNGKTEEAQTYYLADAKGRLRPCMEAAVLCSANADEICSFSQHILANL